MNKIPQELMNKYNSEIPQKLEQLKSLLDEFLAKRKDLVAFIHKLAGNAGTYGYMDVSVLCKKWEGSLKEKEIEELLEEVKKGFYGETK